MTIDDGAMSKNPDSSASNTDPRQVQQELGEILQKFREHKGWSQAEVARRMGVSRQAVSMWEAGTNHPTRRRFYELFQLLGAQPVADVVAQLNLKVPADEQKAATIPFLRTQQVEGWEDRFSLGPEGYEPIPQPNSIPASSYVICFLMPGTSMLPWRSPGEPVFVDLSTRPTIGDHALIRFGKTDGKNVEEFQKGPFIVRLVTDVGPESVRIKSYFTNKEEIVAAEDVMPFYVLEWHELYGPLAIPPSINN